MRRIMFFLAPLFFTLTAQLCAKDYALVLAGGCDQTLSMEMFKEAFSFADAIKNRGWDVTVLHSNKGVRGNRNRVYDITKNDFANKYDLSKYKVLDFTRDAIKESLSALATKVKKGDQVLINIITHGLPVSSIKGHIICIYDKPYEFNVDELKTMGLDAIYAKGVEIAILDNSCYGGESIATFEDKACVISTQTPRFPSIAVQSNNNDPDVFGITSVVTIQMKKSNNKLSIEDYYLKALATYPSWTALKDPVIVSVFPNMSGDYKGNSLSDFASIYSFLSSGEYSSSIDLKNYYQESFCVDMVAMDKENLSVQNPSYDQCVSELKNISDEKYNLFENIRYFFSLNRKDLNLNTKAVKDLKAELKNLLDKINKIYAEIKVKEKLLLTQKETFFASFNAELKNKQVRVRNCIPNKDMVKLLEGSEQMMPIYSDMTYKEAKEILLEKGCTFFKETNELECPCCEIHNYLTAPLFFTNPKNRTWFVMLDASIKKVLDRMIFMDDPCDNSYMEQALKGTDIENNVDLHKKADAYEFTRNELYRLKQSIQSETEKFNMTFNKLKAVIYIKSTSKAIPNEKIKRCRKFKI